MLKTDLIACLGLSVQILQIANQYLIPRRSKEEVDSIAACKDTGVPFEVVLSKVLDHLGSMAGFVLVISSTQQQ